MTAPNQESNRTLLESLTNLLEKKIARKEDSIFVKKLDQNNELTVDIALSELRVGSKCVDRCDFASLAIINEIEEIVEEKNISVELIAVAFTGRNITQHTALRFSTTINRESIIVDYTVRQFCESLSFPFMATPEEWFLVINKESLKKNGIAVKGYFENGYPSKNNRIIPLSEIDVSTGLIKKEYASSS